jgi:hypothetical protein
MPQRLSSGSGAARSSQVGHKREPWAKANQFRLDDDRLMMRALMFYFAALAALLVLVPLGC